MDRRQKVCCEDGEGGGCGVEVGRDAEIRLGIDYNVSLLRIALNMDKEVGSMSEVFTTNSASFIYLVVSKCLNFVK